MLNSFYLPLLFLLTTFSAKAQQPGAVVDVQHYRLALQLNDDNNNIKGQATIDLNFLKTAGSFKLDLVQKNEKGQGMVVKSVTENGKQVGFIQQDSSALIIRGSGKKKSKHSYLISYSGIPQDGLIISTNKHGQRTFFGDNWAMRAQNWLPCVDNPSDKATVEFVVTTPAHYTVVANGLKVSERLIGKDQKITHWQETAKLPTKVMVIGVADFAVKQSGVASGIPISAYVFQKDSTAGFKTYAVATEIMPYFTSNIGPFPYKKLANVQSKTIFGGMENAGAIFYYEESVNAPNAELLVAHEMAHQWFGDAISEKSWWHVWLSEGFSTYMANLYNEHKHGIEALNKSLASDRKAIFQFEKKYMAPVVDSTFTGQPINMLNTNAYQKGGFVLHMLRRKIGDAAFWRGVSGYYKKYNGSNANTDDLRKVMEQAGGQNLQTFFTQWLRRAGHPVLNVKWQYNPADKTLTLTGEQQGELYEYPLEYSVDGKMYTIQLKSKRVSATIPAASEQPLLIFDPNINLLAEINVENK
jgi:aminopeptidase N